jgi:hypothetical protein
MRTLTTASIALAILSAHAWGQEYKDGATSDWFKSLTSPYTLNCCDQADCHRVQSDYRDGSWWALSTRTNEWVRIPEDKITRQVSIFTDAVLCEGDPELQTAPNVHYEPRVYCFAPAPFGF